MAKATPLFAIAAEEVYPTEPERIVAMGLELESDAAPVIAAVDRVVTEGRVLRLLEALEEMPTTSIVAGRIWERVATPQVVRQLATQDPPDFNTLDRLALRVGAPAAEPLLDALALAESRGARRGFLGLLARLGPSIGPVVVARLDDARWYVTRNLLALLDELGELPPSFSAARWMAHSDGRVRLQALKLQLKVPADPGSALIAALRDSDPRVVRVALAKMQQGSPASVVPHLARCAADGAAPTDLRVLAIRALAATRAPLARDTLLELARGGRTFFGREKLPPRSPELITALRALAAGWPSHPAVRRVLARAAASKDPDIRAATDSLPGRS
jgi:hypothetical protein